MSEVGAGAGPGGGGARDAGDDPPPGAGLCTACRHRRVVRSVRGARFVLCRRSVVDPAFPRYPTLPVLRCVGYEPRPAAT